MNDKQVGFIREHQHSFSFAYRLVDLIAINLCLLAAVGIRGVDWHERFFLLGLLGSILFVFISESIGLYKSWRSDSFTHLALTVLLGWSLSLSILVFVAYFSKTSEDYSRIVVGVWGITTAVSLIFWRYCFRIALGKIRSKGFNTRTAVIIGGSSTGVDLGKNLIQAKQLGIKLLGFYDDRMTDREGLELPEKLLGNSEQAIELAKNGGVDLIYVALPMKAESRIVDILSRCADTTATVHIVPDFFTYNLLHSRWCQVGNIPTLSVYDTPFYGVSSWLKRTQDVVLSVIILSIIILPMLLISIGIKLTSKGSIIFKQDRYGLDGRKIEVWKFRTMKVSDNGDVVKQATKNDSRITPFGGFLRRTSLDELPQFLNVLQGSMSIVGPRPHAVSHNEEYRSLVEGYMLRHKVKPGITGWAQVNGFRGETDTIDKMEKRVEHDLAYIRNWSLTFDIKIILLTVAKGFRNTNAY